MTLARRLELPTWLVAATIYGGWIALTWSATRLSPWVVAPLGGFLVAWHSSLQHEIIHGHPTRTRWVNTLLALPPLGLWLPYPLYRDSHLAHHRTGRLTDPLDDPESYYLTADAWAKRGPLRRARWWIERTLVGRLVLGPISMVTLYLAAELARLVRGDLAHARAWAVHVVLVGGLVAWLELACGFGVGWYVLLFAWPGASLMLLRSFAEHRPARANAERTAVVEAWPVFGLLYLHNNLHVVHHDAPGAPWYELPRRWRADRDAILASNNGYVFRRGYLEIAWRWAVVPKDPPPHPGDPPAAEGG